MHPHSGIHLLFLNINNITRLVNLSLFFQGADIKLVLEGEILKLVEPKTKKILHTQPIAKMRVWGVGRVETRSVRNHVPQFIRDYRQILLVNLERI